jgi:hypothetical protein
VVPYHYNEAYSTIVANKENEINRLVSVINALTKIKTK